MAVTGKIGPGAITVNMGQIEGLTRWERTVLTWGRDMDRKLMRLFTRLGFKWRAEAVKRVPVDMGTLVNQILNVTYKRGGVIITDVGSNIRSEETGFEYPAALEFGTERIAGGAVKALGDDPEISDSQAIRDWPAKDAGLEGLEPTLAAKSREQMPWLRPAWVAVKPWFLRELKLATRPPQN